MELYKSVLTGMLAKNWPHAELEIEKIAMNFTNKALIEFEKRWSE